MKFNCYKEDLSDALQFAIKAVAVKPMTPILAGIYLKAEGSTLELQANNFSTGIITKIPINTETSGEVVVSGKRFVEFVRNMPEETITFSDEDNGNILTMQSGGADVELLTMTAADFPKVKTPETDKSFKIRTSVLRNLIRKTVFAVSKDDSRPLFTGCCFEIKGNKISLVATNTHRLALAVEELSDTYDESAFIVPAETLRGLMARLSSAQGENYVTINYSTRYLTFDFDNVFMNARLIEGQFPSYDRVIPSSSTTDVRVKRDDFKRVVEFIALMSKETEYNTIKLVFGDGNIEISSNSPEVGGATWNVDAEIAGNDLDISFNVDYISDVLKVIDSEYVCIALNDRFSPAAFTEPNNDNYVYVATPVRA